MALVATELQDRAETLCEACDDARQQAIRDEARVENDR